MELVEKLLFTQEYAALNLLDHMSLKASLLSRLYNKTLARDLIDRRPTAPVLPPAISLVQPWQVQQGLTTIEIIVRAMGSSGHVGYSLQQLATALPLKL